MIEFAWAPMFSGTWTYLSRWTIESHIELYSNVYKRVQTTYPTNWQKRDTKRNRKQYQDLLSKSFVFRTRLTENEGCCDSKWWATILCISVVNGSLCSSQSCCRPGRKVQSSNIRAWEIANCGLASNTDCDNAAEGAILVGMPCVRGHRLHQNRQPDKLKEDEGFGSRFCFKWSKLRYFIFTFKLKHF